MKKEYMHPEMDVMALNADTVLLAGSGETMDIFSEETDEALAPMLDFDETR